MDYKELPNDHDFFDDKHVEGFLRNHGTGVNNVGRRRLGWIINEYNKPSVLDVACGTCVNYETWSQMGIDFDYCGVDRTKKFIQHANKLYGNKIQAMMGFAQDLPFADGEKDIVVLRHVLEHLPEYETVVKEAIRVASREVILVFFLPLIDGEDNQIEKRSSNIEGRPDIFHYWNTYSLSKLKAFLYDLGLKPDFELVFTPGAAHHDTICRIKLNKSET